MTPDSALKNLEHLSQLEGLGQEPTDEAAFWACADKLGHLADEDWARRFVNDDLARVANESSYVPSRPASQLEYRLFANQSLALSLHVHVSEAAAGPLVTSIAHQMIVVLGSGHVDIRRYHLPPPHRFELLDRSKRLECLGVSRVQSPEIVKFRAGEDLYEIASAPLGTSYLVMSSHAVHRFQWFFDRESLAPLAIASADRTATRVEFACRLIAELGGAPSIDGLVAAAGHPDHFVRWAAIQAATRLDPSGGIRLLRSALEDSHPHIQRVAQRMLAIAGK